MKKISYIIIAIVTCISCSQNEISIPVEQFENNIKQTEIQIIKKLENPYSVSNVKKAYESLQNDGMLRSNIHIEATHLYVRFLPKDTADFNILKADTTLVLFSYPLDYELTEGEVFVDPELGKQEYSWLYTKVPTNYVSPIVGYEILEEIFVPNDEDDEIDEENTVFSTRSNKKTTINNYDWEIIEKRALELTGNSVEEDDYTSLNTNTLRSKSFTPKATIQVYDDQLGKYIPVPGAKVRARWWFNWKSNYTKEDGTVNVGGSFKKLNWSIAWEDSDWDIRDGLLLQAYYNGPTSSTTQHWQLNISGGKSKTYAHVTRACYVMLKDNYAGLGMTSSEKVTASNRGVIPMKISVYDKYDEDKAAINYAKNWYGFSIIGIYMKNTKNTYRPSDDTFGTIIHEIAHSVHANIFSLGLAQFIFVKSIIQESWATYTESTITTEIYRKLGAGNSYEYYTKQGWALLKTDYSESRSGSVVYSPIFIDLADSYNQRSIYATSYPKYEFPEDNVSGFTPTELRSVIRKVYNLNDLKQQVKSLRTDQTIKNNIDILFETYEKAK